MQQLTNSQVEFIYLDILRKGITHSSLQEDVVDHICCLVEIELDHTPDFKTAYLKVLKDFGSFRILQVVTNEEIKAASWHAGVLKALNYLSTFIILVFSLALLALPPFIALNTSDTLFPFLFLPTVITGCIICFTRINYRKFKLVAF